MRQSVLDQTDATHATGLAVVDPAFPVAPQIFAQLRDRILDMTFAPGQYLSEPDIADQIGASRTPVREALARLRSIGLVATLPSRGSYVTKINGDRVREAQYLREAMEVAHVRHLALQGVSDDTSAALTANLAAQETAMTSGDAPGFHACDDAFHLTLAAATGHARAPLVLSEEKAQLDRLRLLHLQDGVRLPELLAEHHAIWAALRARDEVEAVAQMRRHVQGVLRVLAALADSHADYFDAD